MQTFKKIITLFKQIIVFLNARDWIEYPTPQPFQYNSVFMIQRTFSEWDSSLQQGFRDARSYSWDGFPFSRPTKYSLYNAVVPGIS